MSLAKYAMDVDQAKVEVGGRSVSANAERVRT